jgi:hypothetical protein
VGPVTTPYSQAELFGGPEDGAIVWVSPGAPPELLGVVRLEDGALVPVRDQRQLEAERQHVVVYVRAPELDHGCRCPDRRHARPVYRWRNGRPGQPA